MWSQNLLKNVRESTAENNSQILLTKCWGVKEVFHAVNFRQWRFFCGSFKKSCCDNIETTLGKTFMWKCDINFFWNRTSSSQISCWGFPVYFRVLLLLFTCCDDNIYSLYCFALFKKTKSSLREYILEMFFQLRMLNSCIQQGFSLWCKVNWVENFLKCRPVASLVPCKRCLMEVFCENRSLLLAVHYFRKNVPAYMFHRVLNAPL